MSHKSGQGIAAGGKVGQTLKKICVISGKSRAIPSPVTNNLKINFKKMDSDHAVASKDSTEDQISNLCRT